MEYLIVVIVFVYLIYQHEQDKRMIKKLNETYQAQQISEAALDEIRKRDEHFKALMEYTPEQAYKRGR